MSEELDAGIECAEPDCWAWAVNESVALGRGWYEGENGLICPVHEPFQAVQARSAGDSGDYGEFLTENEPVPEALTARSVSHEQAGGVSCPEENCWYWCFDEGLAEGTGWFRVGDTLFCPDHGPLHSLQARNQARRDVLTLRAERISARVRDDAAKSSLTTRDYANWHEFQQQLVNFHRKHGKLAPAALRVLTPKDWLALHQEGPIDVEKAAEEHDRAKQERQGRTWERMIRDLG